MTTTVRIKADTHALLSQLAAETGETMQDVLARALESYRRQLILAQTNAAYAALRENRSAYKTLEDERGAWDSALLDGLDEPATGDEE